MANDLLAAANTAAARLDFKFPYGIEEWLTDKHMLMENYHKHTTASNFFQFDSSTSIGDFVNLSKEYGCQCYFSGEHGYAGEWLSVYDFCKNNDIRFRYSAELYWVKDIESEEKDNTNCHIVVIARTYNAIRKLNYIITRANDEGFYYKPRIDLNMLFTLSPDEVYVTSACVAGWKYEDATEIWYRVWQHFGDSFFLEYQAHNTEEQKVLNKKIFTLSQQTGMKTIIGLDTHYISDEDMVKRDNLLIRKGLHYADEDGWYMDFPNGEELFHRMQEQGVLSDEEILYAMMNTHTFIDGCEEFEYDTDFKIPIYKEYDSMSYDERCEILKQILNQQYSKEDSEHRGKERIDGIRYEFNEIIGSQTADYFIDNFKIVNLATTKYKGQLTTTSRGSAASYYCSKLLGFTTMDRFEAEVPIYPERFITKDRVLSSHQMPDIDLNVSAQQPFIDAARELFGEHSCYPLLAVGKFGEKSGFKMYADVAGLEPVTANEITTMIDQYNEALKEADDDNKDSIQIEDYITDKRYLQIFNESKPYQGIIEQAKVHACGFALFNGNPRQKDVVGYGDIRYEFGLIRCHSESTGKSTLVANVEGGFLDSYGYVKDDFLIVDVVGIINKLYRSIGKDVPSVAELRKMVFEDPLTWNLYAQGYTCCLNQCEKPGTTQKAKKYKPQNIKELAAFIAGIRPGFKSQIDTFLARTEHSTGESDIDELLTDSSHFMIYQESIMKVLGFLGVSMKDTYGTIKAISKKKLKGEKKEHLLNQLKENWMKHFGNLDNFNNIWNVIEDSARYAFNCVSGETIIKTSNKSSVSVEEMYRIMNDFDYAKEHNQIALYRKYNRYGYGTALSVFENGKVYRNTIIDINLAKTTQTYKVTTSTGSYIICTAEHKFPTPDGKVMLKDLKVGDSLYTLNKTKQPVDDDNFNLFSGDSVIYEGEKIKHRISGDKCEVCGKPYSKMGHFDLEYKNNYINAVDNFQWVCNDCKTLSLEDNGLSTFIDTIVSIKKYKVEKTYNIEMASPAKNFISDSGLITCNSPHALAMANDSLYEAWMKGHHTSKFYEVTLNHYQEKEDKNKVAELLKEATTCFGYKVGHYEYGQDNSHFVVDAKKKMIYPNLGSVKGIGSKVVQTMYEISQSGKTDIVDIYMSIGGTPVNGTVFRNLIKIGYFRNIGSVKYLLQCVDIVDQWKGQKYEGKKKISKTEANFDFDLSPYATDVLPSGKISDKQYTITDWVGLVKEICKHIPTDEYKLSTLLKFQYEILGYIEYMDPKMPKNYIVVTNLNTNYSPKFKGYCIATGQVCDLKVHKQKPKKKDAEQWFDQLPFEDGDTLYMKKCIKKARMKKVDDNWVASTTEFDWWITDYTKV